ncbi:putative E3 ubiquitin-protein ligase RHG1A [Drosera capensis]
MKTCVHCRSVFNLHSDETPIDTLSPSNQPLLFSPSSIAFDRRKISAAARSAYQSAYLEGLAHLSASSLCSSLTRRLLLEFEKMSGRETHQQWNYMRAEDPYPPYHHLAPVRCAATGNSFHPRNTMPPVRENYLSPWIPPARLHGHSSSSRAALQNSFETSGPRNPLHQLPTSKNYPQHASSSNYVVENNILDISMSNQRYPCKRKSPGIPPISERGVRSGNYSWGSSSDAYFSADSQRERSSVDVHRTHWELVNVTPTCRPHGLSVDGESSTRNVRRRYALQSEFDVFGNNQPGNYPHQTNLNRHPLDHPVYHQHQVPPVPLPLWNPCPLPTFPRAMATLPGPGRSHHHGVIDPRTPNLPQRLTAVMDPSTRRIHSSYVHRTNLARASMLIPPERLTAFADNVLSSEANTNSSAHGSFGSSGCRLGLNGGRPRFGELYRSLSVGAAGYDRSTPEAIMIADHAAFYTSMSLLDQHSDMRLDIDNMSYEELLELSERIGSVNTGVPDQLLPRCFTATQYCSLKPVPAERCSICLEEYQETDGIVTMNACGHDYHEHCIKKWLSMKNLCPVCKVVALPD